MNYTQYSYKQLDENRETRYNKQYMNYKREKLLQKQNTCDCCIRSYERKPHHGKEGCIDDLTNRIIKAYNQGGHYFMLDEDDCRFSIDTIDIVIKDFKNKGLNEIWYHQYLLFAYVIIVFKKYTIWHRAYFYFTGGMMPDIFDF